MVEEEKTQETTEEVEKEQESAPDEEAQKVPSIVFNLEIIDGVVHYDFTKGVPPTVIMSALETARLDLFMKVCTSEMIKKVQAQMAQMMKSGQIIRPDGRTFIPPDLRKEKG